MQQAFLADASLRVAQVVKVQRWDKLIKSYGGTIAVIGPDNVDRNSFVFAGQRQAIIATLNDLGSALQDVGVTAAVHQYAGSCITTRDETYAVMEAVNTEVVKLWPDIPANRENSATPYQVAAASKRAFQDLGYQFR